MKEFTIDNCKLESSLHTRHKHWQDKLSMARNKRVARERTSEKKKVSFSIYAFFRGLTLAISTQAQTATTLGTLIAATIETIELALQSNAPTTFP